MSNLSDVTFVPVDDLGPDQRWSTWSSVDAKTAHGPRPYPDWVITDDGAVDTLRGIVKTGKEADVYLLDRSVPGDPQRRSTLACKRYRSTQHRDFTRGNDYTAGRRLPKRKSREARAAERKTAFGRTVASTQWAQAEFHFLTMLFTAGVPVPYPVQIDGTEILMEFIGDDGYAAPRLAHTAPTALHLAEWFEQARAAMLTMGRLQLAHGDLSAFNMLAAGERLVIIDVPQVVDLVANPLGLDFLHRDCRNVCQWFGSKGLDVDPDALFADVVAVAW